MKKYYRIVSRKPVSTRSFNEFELGFKEVYIVQYKLWFWPGWSELELVDENYRYVKNRFPNAEAAEAALNLQNNLREMERGLPPITVEKIFY